MQSEAARQLSVSTVTLSRWETDKVYPTWPQQPKIVEFLGYNPFTTPELGRPTGNETHGVAFLSPTAPETFGQRLRNRRLELKKNRAQFAKELGVSVKTLWGWETDRRNPSRALRDRIRIPSPPAGTGFTHVEPQSGHTWDTHPPKGQKG